MKEKTRERVASLPDDVWDCERCGGNNTMQIRRSSLNETFMADDVGLKCSECYYYATHGIAFEDPDQFQSELEKRDSRVIDFAKDGHNVKEQLKSLGYLAKAEDI